MNSIISFYVYCRQHLQILEAHTINTILIIIVPGQRSSTYCCCSPRTVDFSLLCHYSALFTNHPPIQPTATLTHTYTDQIQCTNHCNRHYYQIVVVVFSWLLSYVTRTQQQGARLGHPEKSTRFPTGNDAALLAVKCVLR